jgi:methylamine dehydrogenase light chain
MAAEHTMNPLDRWLERTARKVARRTSRRSHLAWLGRVLLGAPLLPLLPVARGAAAATNAPEPEGPEGDPKECAYWRHCAIDGYACSCCGGSQSSCPPGTEMSSITWIGTCTNPADGRDYVISYNDCCGKTSCGRCFCARTEGDKAIYYPQKSGDINWCQGTTTNVYHCSAAIVIGVADK